MRFSLLSGFDYGRSIMLHAVGNHRSLGVALLVAFAFFSTPAIAQWSANDSYRLDQIYLQLGGDYNSSHSIHSDLAQVLSLHRGVFNVSSNTYELLDQFFYEFRDVLSPDGDGGYDAVNIDFNLDGYTPYVHRELPYDPRTSAELLVTNRAETYWLEKIYQAITYGGLGSGGSPLTVGQLANRRFITWTFMVDNYASALDDVISGDMSVGEFLLNYDSTQWDLVRAYMYAPWSVMSYSERTAFSSYASQVTPLGTLPSNKQTFFWNNIINPYGSMYYNYYGTKSLRDYFEQSGINSDNFSPTNFFTADGSLENSDNAFTNSETSVFSKFATSFLPYGMFDPDSVNTDLFEYVDSDISESPTFNPAPIAGNGGLRSSSADSFDYDFEDSSGEYDYNLINPLKTATDKVQQDTELDNKFSRLAELVNLRITAIFQNPLNSISSQPARWQASLIDKDMQKTEDYVDPQYSNSSDGVQFVCWCVESMMFFGFFSFCVRRSLRVQQSRDVASAI